MVNATIDNSVVSIQLSSGQSTTVPSNQNWKVTVIIGLSTPQQVGFGGFRDSETFLKVNGIDLRYSVDKAIGKRDNNNNGSGVSSHNIGPVDLALTGGDTVQVNGDSCFIQGFVVAS